jgi:hypothetical protein
VASRYLKKPRRCATQRRSFLTRLPTGDVMKIRIAEMDRDVSIHRDNPRSWNMSLATMPILLAFIIGLMVLPNDAFARDKNAKAGTGQQDRQKFGNNQGWGTDKFGNNQSWGLRQFGNNQGWGIERFGSNQLWGTDRFGNQYWGDNNRKNNGR